MQAAAFVGQETTFTADGKEWKLARWTLDIWSKFQGWAKEVLPDPLKETAKSIEDYALKDAEILRKLMIADQKEEQAAALEKRQPILMAPLFRGNADRVLELASSKAHSLLALDSPEIASVLKSAVGQTKLLQLLLEKYHGGAENTMERAQSLYDEIGAVRLGELLAVASGKAPGSPKNG